MNSYYSLAITVLASLATCLWTVYKYFDTKKRDQDLKEFDNYHRLVKELVQPGNDGLYIDRQTAILFEFRNFKRYYPHSYRMLVGLKEKWENVPNQYPRLLDELNRTIEFLKTKQ